MYSFIEGGVDIICGVCVSLVYYVKGLKICVEDGVIGVCGILVGGIVSTSRFVFSFFRYDRSAM